MFIPPKTVMPGPAFTTQPLVKKVRHSLEEYLPSVIMDFLMRLMHRKPSFCKLQSKVQKAVSILEFFTRTEWEFTADNLFLLLNEMNETDKLMFNIDIRDLNWENYLEQYCIGTKVFLLKEDLAKVSQVRQELSQ